MAAEKKKTGRTLPIPRGMTKGIVAEKGEAGDVAYRVVGMMPNEAHALLVDMAHDTVRAQDIYITQAVEAAFRAGVASERAVWEGKYGPDDRPVA